VKIKHTGYHVFNQSSFTPHVHLGGLQDLLVDDELRQRLEQRGAGMNEHRVVQEGSL